MKLKCLKPIHYHKKLCNNLLFNARGVFLTSKSETTQKMTKNFQKQFEKISINYRVYVWSSNRYSAWQKLTKKWQKFSNNLKKLV